MKKRRMEVCFSLYGVYTCSLWAYIFAVHLLFVLSVYIQTLIRIECLRLQRDLLLCILYILNVDQGCDLGQAHSP